MGGLAGAVPASPRANRPGDFDALRLRCGPDVRDAPRSLSRVRERRAERALSPENALDCHEAAMTSCEPWRTLEEFGMTSKALRTLFVAAMLSGPVAALAAPPPAKSFT